MLLDPQPKCHKIGFKAKIVCNSSAIDVSTRASAETYRRETGRRTYVQPKRGKVGLGKTTCLVTRLPNAE